MTRARNVLALILLGALACSARSPGAATPTTPVQFTIRVRNNLSMPLNLSASHATAVIWNGSVAANATHEAMIGPIPPGSLISLRATTAQGTVVSLRDSISVREGLVIWTIP